MTQTGKPSIYLLVSTILTAIMLLVTACNAPARVTVAAPTPTVPARATGTALPPTPPAPTEKPAGSSVPINDTALLTIDLNGVAQLVTSQVIPAVQPGDNVSEFQVMPQYTLLTLQGYPLANTKQPAQIYIYLIGELAVNQSAAKQAAGLQTLLQNQQVGDQIPYLPLVFSSKQAILAQIKFLETKSGKGVRFLTEWHNGLSPINNQDLIYTYQSLTSDGKYYIAAVLPVNLPGLPADSLDTTGLPANFPEGYSQYLVDTVSHLNQQPLNAFTPDLSGLDAMLQSIEIK